jgi:glutaconate CoA-transferase subunit A
MTDRKPIKNKIMSPKEAIRRFVHDGAHISIGGFTIVRNPMGLIHEIIRQGLRDLHVYVHSHGQAFDLLIGAGCVNAMEFAYGGTARFSPSGGIRFRKAIEEGRVRFEDYTNYQMVLRFLAGAMGLPFLPLKGVIGTDVLKKWGFDKTFRLQNPRLPDKKLSTIKNPFDEPGKERELVVVPAIQTDVTLLHVQKADSEGTCRIEGLTFADVEQAKAARHVIISCEELVPREEIRKDADRNQIPFFIVDAVVPLPYGAHPTACNNYYDYDDDHLMLYGRMASSDNDFQAYLDTYIYGTETYAGYLDQIGKKMLEMLRADPDLGYRPRNNRRSENDR